MSTETKIHRETKETLMDILVFQMEKVFSLQEEKETNFRFYNKNYKNLYLKVHEMTEGLSPNEIKLLTTCFTID